MLQAQWYMAMCNQTTTCPRWYIACLFSGSHYVEYCIKYDAEIGNYLMLQAVKFLDEHVDKLIPPEADSSEGCRRYLSNLYQTHTDVLRDATAEEAELISCLRARQLELKELKDIVEKTKNSLRLVIANDAGVRDEAGIVTWKTQAGSKSLDSDAVKTKYPDVHDECVKQGESLRVLRVK